MKSVTYNVLKVAEGGMGAAYAVILAKNAGATKVQKIPSIFVGNDAIRVTASKRVHDLIFKALYA